jgi:hypothetical protein
VFELNSANCNGIFQTTSTILQPGNAGKAPEAAIHPTCKGYRKMVHFPKQMSEVKVGDLMENLKKTIKSHLCMLRHFRPIKM